VRLDHDQHGHAAQHVEIRSAARTVGHFSLRSEHAPRCALGSPVRGDSLRSSLVGRC
jgi:hypothetical protein